MNITKETSIIRETTRNKYRDQRGIIDMVLEDFAVGSVSKIVSLAGSTRAKHWHKTDSHWCYLEFGQIEYFEQSLDGGFITKHIINPGDCFYTAPKTKHEMYFPTDSLFWCFSALPRSKQNYENETIRFEESLKTKFENGQPIK